MGAGDPVTPPVPGSSAAIAPRLASALETVTVAADGLAASVGSREIHAETPGKLEYLLAAALYDVLHAGRTVPREQARGLREPVLEAELAAAIPHRSTTREVTLVAVRGDEVLAELDGVKVRMDRASLDGPAGPGGPGGAAGQPPVPGSPIAVRIPAARPALSPGFFLADGTRPLGEGSRVLRVYLHLETMEAALAAWSALLHLLEQAGTGYRAKVASCRALLPRRDALVVYLGAGDHGVHRLIADEVAGLTGLGPSASVFADPVRPGIAIAWEPADHRAEMKGLSFGEHRSRALAAALVQHALLAADRRPVTVAAAVHRSFLAAGIDPANPARNLTSPM